MSLPSQRHTPAVKAFQTYMLSTLYQIGVTMKLFSPVSFCCAESSCNTTPKFLQAQQGIKDSFKKISREFCWLIVSSSFAITESNTPSSVTVSPLWKAESWDGQERTPARLTLTTKPPGAVQTVRRCGSGIFQNQNRPQVDSYQTSPPPESPPWIFTMQNNHLLQPHINIDMRVWRSLNKTVISLNMRHTESGA